MTKLKIKVTKEILERSKMCGDDSALISQNCAVALAVRDIFPDAAIGVDRMHFGVTLFDGDINLPKIAVDFIQKFDDATPAQRVKMDEIEFEIPIPDTVIEQINIDEIKPLLENHPTLELITQ